jgi:hypothetical protein
MQTTAKKVGASGRSPVRRQSAAERSAQWGEGISAFVSRRPAFTTDELYAALSDAPDFDDICGAFALGNVVRTFGYEPDLKGLWLLQPPVPNEPTPREGLWMWMVGQ